MQCSSHHRGGGHSGHNYSRYGCGTVNGVGVLGRQLLLGSIRGKVAGILEDREAASLHLQPCKKVLGEARQMLHVVFKFCGQAIAKSLCERSRVQSAFERRRPKTMLSHAPRARPPPPDLPQANGHGHHGRPPPPPRPRRLRSGTARRRQQR